MPIAVKPTRSARPGYLASLDGWRAVAIASVMLYHDHVRRLGSLSTAFPHRWGALGVDLFFAISGLLITTRLLEEERLFGRFSLKGFYLRRLFRIQPAALFFLGILVLLHVAAHLPLAFRGVAEALTVTRNIADWHGTGPDMRVTEHFWSLSIEEQFYLVLPCTLLLVRHRRARLSLLLALGTGFFVWAAISHRLPYYVELRGHHTELNVHGLLLASFLAVWVSNAKRREAARRWLSPYLVTAAIIALAALRAWKHHYDVLWLTAAFPVLVLSTVLHPGSLISRALEWAPLRFVGRISYSLYLWQQLFLVAAHFAAGTAWGWMDVAPVNYALAVTMALVSFYLIEKPAIRWGHRVAPPPTPGRDDLAEKSIVPTGPALA